MKRLGMRRKHRLAIRCCHWVNFPLLVLMTWSGLWIYWANDVYRIGLGSFTLVKFFTEGFYRAFGVSHRLAEGMAWHFFFMWFFALNGVIYVVYTTLSGEWRSLVPDRQSFREAILVALHDLGLWKGKLPERKFNGAQQIAYTGVILVGFGSLVTGLAIYKPTQFAWLTGLLGGYMAAKRSVGTEKAPALLVVSVSAGSGPRYRSVYFETERDHRQNTDYQFSGINFGPIGIERV